MRDLTMRDIMTRSFAAVCPEDDLQKVASLLRKTKVDALPVVSRLGELIGIMTKANLYDAVASGLPPSVRVADLYTREVMTLPEDLTYEELAEIVRTSHAGNAVIMNALGGPAGLFTKTDWIMAMFRHEAALNSQLTAILDTMHNGLIAVDTNGHITMTNKAAEGILGGDCLGRPLAEFLPGLAIDDVLRDARKKIGLRHVVRDEVTLLCNITPFVRDEGAGGAIIVIQDITDLHRIVTQLETVSEINETLQSVMDLAYDGIIVVDNSGRISMVNRAAARFFRRREEEMVGRPVEEVVENTRLEEVLRSGVQEINQLQFIHGVPFVVSRLPIIRGGKVVGAVGKILFRNLDELQDIAVRFARGEYEIAQEKDGAIEEVPSGFNQIVTADPFFRHMLEEAEIAARGNSNILITGESGTGKELVAQAIHHRSLQRQGPLVRVNCAAIPDSLMEAEFFGYAPGAFTGARRSGRPGKLLSANGGTLFLDEIGDLPLNLQGKLLRVLQDRRYEPIGSDKSVQVNVRFIAATNRDLHELTHSGRFREDLYYRLNVVNLNVPPLRARKDDIILLAQFFLEKYNHVFHTEVRHISPVVQRLFLHHPWPGNVRELENVIERAINFARDSVLHPGDLPAYLRETPLDVCAPVAQDRPALTLRPAREGCEREMILDALSRAGGNKARAARLLGISRSWLYEKMARNGLT